MVIKKMKTMDAYSFQTVTRKTDTPQVIPHQCLPGQHVGHYENVKSLPPLLVRK